jgi:hypothetical protein
MKLLPIRDELMNRREFGLFDDFFWYLSPHAWTSLTTGSGAAVAAAASQVGGAVTLTTGATGNNEAAIGTTTTPFKLAVEKPLLFEAAIQYAEANTSDAGMLVGFASAINTTGMLADTTLLPAASFSGAVIYKSKGQTKWSFRTSVGSAFTDTATQHPAGGSAFQTLRIEVRQSSSGLLEAVPFLGEGLPGAVTRWTQMLDANNKPIKQTFDPTSAAGMQAGAFAKAGGSHSEVMTIDYLGAYQLR